MTRTKRIDAAEAHRRVERGDALLVCAYDDEEKCDRVAIGPSISYGEFLRRRPQLDESQEVIFY